MDAKGKVMCATDQTVTFTVELWKCASEPVVSSDIGDLIGQLQGGAWGCDESWSDPYTIDVLAGAWSEQYAAFADEGPDANAYYIAATYGPGVDPSVSQVIVGNSLASP